MTTDVGSAMPDARVTLIDGRVVTLADHAAGAPLLLWFYPKDDTAGCTREAQDFSALAGEFAQLGVTMLGVSKDTPAKHRRFIDKYDLSVPLGTDADGELLAAFDAWVAKKLYGREYMGIDRSTFLFGADGRLYRAWRKVRVPGHADEVLAAARAMADA